MLFSFDIDGAELSVMLVGDEGESLSIVCLEHLLKRKVSLLLGKGRGNEKLRIKNYCAICKAITHRVLVAILAI